MNIDQALSLLQTYTENTMNESSECPSLISVVQTQQEQIKTLQDTVTKLTKELADEKRYHNNTREENKKFNDSIQEVHTFLNCLENPPPEKTSHEEAYYRKELSILTRVAIYFSTKSSARGL